MSKQLEIHRDIELIIQSNPGLVEPSRISNLINKNLDAKNYFFAVADKRWLGWLWENGFLDAIKQKSEDPTKYSYKLPELNYIDRMSKEIPAKVVEIMLEVDVVNNFNPEVVDRFARTCSELPATQLKKIIPKIAKDNWVKLMSRFGGHHGFEYKSMLKTLDEAKDYKSLLTLSKTILSTKDKNEMDDSDSYNKDPFCLGDLSYSEVFDYIVKVDDEYTKQALDQTVDVLGKALSVIGNDEFFLMEDNVFTLEIHDREGLSPRSGIRNLMAVIKVFADRIAAKDSKYVVDTIFKLPEDSALARRLKLYAVTIRPMISIPEIKKLLFSVFDAIDPATITIGAEYDTVLQKCFGMLSSKDRQEYINKAINLPNRCKTDKERERFEHIASGLFPHIAEALTKAQKNQIENAGYSIGEKIEPRPMIGEVSRAQLVTPKGPITQEEFDVISVKNIVKKLCYEWSPAELEKKNNPRDFLNPLDAEGVGNLIRNSMAKRFKEFMDSAILFYSKDINMHYTYSLLRGTEEVIKDNFEQASKVNFDQMLELLIIISEEKDEHINDDTAYSGWLADSKSVKSMSANVLKAMLRKHKEKSIIDFEKIRDRLLTIIGSLLEQPYPSQENEEYTTATMTVTSQETGKLVSSPYSMAINSVRGTAFEALVLFIHRDGDTLKVDVKERYEKLLHSEKTKALYFIFGHHLSSFYYRDKDWVRELLPKLFSETDKLLYLAAWEGYISANLYEEIFSEPEMQKLYKRGLFLTKKLDPRREFFRDPEKGIAVHLALAYMHYSNFGADNELFTAFWKDGTETQHAEFIDFVGRKYISHDHERENVIKTKSLLTDLWDYILNSCIHKVSLIHFGMWINDKNDIFDKQWLVKQICKTLEKTQGALYWDYGLKKSVIKLAEVSPEGTLEIIRRHLLDYGVNTKGEHRPIFFETEWGEALTITYKNPDTKADTVVLIDALIRDGGSQFWPLKEILKESE